MGKLDVMAELKARFEKNKRRAAEIKSLGITVYFDPLTIKESALINEEAKGDEYVAGLLALIQKAHHADGSKVFEDHPNTVTSLRNEVEAEVIGEFMTAMNGGETADQAKND